MDLPKKMFETATLLVASTDGSLIVANTNNNIEQLRMGGYLAKRISAFEYILLLRQSWVDIEFYRRNA